MSRDFLSRLICMLLLIAGCVPPKPPREGPLHKQSEALNQFLSNLVLSPGKVGVLSFPYFGPFDKEELVCNGESTPIFSDGHERMAHAFIGLSYFFANEEYVCEFTFGDERKTQKYHIRGFRVATIEYPEERLRVGERQVSLSQKDQERAERESHLLQQAFLSGSTEKLFDAPFVLPLKSKITSPYGNRRLFNNKKRSQHLGVDFRAKMGTPIKASNKGRVILTGDFFYGGGIVIIDHGLGIFTTYSHLSKILVSVGDRVDGDSTVGLSGKTGRVNAPHLHWGVRIGGNWVDGVSLMEVSKRIGRSKEELRRDHSRLQLSRIK